MPEPISVGNKNFLEKSGDVYRQTCREMALDRFEQTPGLRDGGRRRAIAVGWASRAFGRSEAEELALPEV